MDTTNNNNARSETAGGIPAVSAMRVQLRQRHRLYPRIAGTYNVYDDNGVCVATGLRTLPTRSHGLLGPNQYSVPNSPEASECRLASVYSTDPLLRAFIALCDELASRPIPSDTLLEGSWRVTRDKVMSVEGISRADATRRVRRLRGVVAGTYKPQDVPTVIAMRPKPQGRVVTYQFTRS